MNIIKKFSLFFLGIVLCIYGQASRSRHTVTVDISDCAARAIGKQIWMNEAKGTKEGLTWWNPKEQFPSLGIGHFIWKPSADRTRFQEGFPSLMQYLYAEYQQEIKESGSASFVWPQWLKPTDACPWRNHQEFVAALDSKKMNELRDMLADTVDLQTTFIINRLETVLPNMLNTLDYRYRFHVKKQFYRMLSSPQGIYALIDYINFKGDGTSMRERYHQEGWGLLQVLKGMEGHELGLPAVQEFVCSATRTLERRVANAPRGQDEKGWLPGWKNRLQTYLTFTYQC